MARGKIITNPKQREEHFGTTDEKLQITLAGLANKYSMAIRNHIYATYHDKKLLDAYREIRKSGIYQKGGKSKVHRKIVEFPNAFVFDFVDTVMTALYDRDWLYNNKALRHELVRPWHVVNKL